MSPLSNLVVIGDGSAELLAMQLGTLIKPPVELHYFKTGTRLDQMSDASNKGLSDYLEKRPNVLKNNPFGLSLDVFLLSHSSNEDPAPLINDVGALLAKNDVIVWIPPFGNPDLAGGLQGTFSEARASGQRLVGILPTAQTQNAGWGAEVLKDLTNQTGIPTSVRI